MGEIDIEQIHKIYRACVDFCELTGLPFQFKEDLGTYETAIQFEDGYNVHPPTAKNWKNNPNIHCPDILDYENKIIIEFEEETGPRKPGAKMATKGHHHEGDYDTKRDTRRNANYTNFRVFRLWQSIYENENWKAKLFQFLLDCHFGRKT